MAWHQDFSYWTFTKPMHHLTCWIGLDDANKEYISKYLNLAQKVVDGSKVYVPFRNGGAVAGVSASLKTNINTSSESDLEKLPGIGAATAAKIIAGRPFGSIEELTTKKLINRSTFEKVKDQIAVY